jgi:hypothetical protein
LCAGAGKDVISVGKFRGTQLVQLRVMEQALEFKVCGFRQSGHEKSRLELTGIQIYTQDSKLAKKSLVIVGVV